MSDPAFGKALRDINFAQRLFPQARLRQLAALRRVADDQSRVFPEAIAPYRTPQVVSMSASGAIRQRVAKAGKITLVSIHAGVAPTTADAVISITSLSEDAPTASVIATVTIPQGQSFGQASPMVSVATGQWLLAVTTASGSGSSFSVSINITQD